MFRWIEHAFRMSHLSPTTMPYCCRRLIVDCATGGIRKSSLERSRAVTLCGWTSRPISPSSYSGVLDTDCWLPKAANTIFRYLGHFAPTLSARLAAKNDTCHPWSKSTRAIANPRLPATVAVVVIKCSGAVCHATAELISCGGFWSRFNNIIMVPPLANLTFCWRMTVFDGVSWPHAVKTQLMLSYVVVAGRHFKLLQPGCPPLYGQTLVWPGWNIALYLSGYRFLGSFPTICYLVCGIGCLKLVPCRLVHVQFF